MFGLEVVVQKSKTIKVSVGQNRQGIIWLVVDGLKV